MKDELCLCVDKAFLSTSLLVTLELRYQSQSTYLFGSLKIAEQSSSS